MEDCTVYYENKKRARDESSDDPYSPKPKLSRVDPEVEYPQSFHDTPVAESPELNNSDSVPDGPESDRFHSVTHTTESYRVDPVDGLSDRVDSVVQDPASPDSIQLTQEIIDILEDTDIHSSIQGLDSVIRSFEEEITTPFPATDSGELDYLLGASDDELGLPPAKSPPNEIPDNKSTELVTTSPLHNMELIEDFAFVDELPVYESSEFGLGEDNYDRTEFVTLGNGLFDYPETPDSLWHQESLTAL